jgi:DNA-directed RNA polymerase specialized sigma24 family protein
LIGDITEAEIILLIKARSHDGFDLLYEKYAADVYGSVMRAVKEDDKTGYILHRVFVRIWQDIDQYDGRGRTFYSWIQNIAAELAEEYMMTKDQEGAANNISEKFASIGNENDEASNLLDQGHRAVIDALFTKGYSYEKASLVLGMPVEMIRIKMKEALKILREK